MLFKIACGLLSSAAIGCCIASQAYATWQTSAFTSTGLYQVCVTGGPCTDIGWNFASQLDYLGLYITRCIFLFADLFLVIGLFLTVVAACAKNKCSKLRSAGGLYITGGIFVLIACVLFTLFNTVITSIAGAVLLNSTNFGVSFYLGWASGPLFIVSGIMLSNAGKDNEKPNQVQPQQIIWSTNAAPQTGQIQGYQVQPY